MGVVVLMSMAVTAYQRSAGLTFTEATSYARALREGLELVAQLGNRATPGAMRLLRVLPLAGVASLLFVASRTGLVKTIGVIGPDEPRALADVMLAASSAPLPSLRAIRP